MGIAARSFTSRISPFVKKGTWSFHENVRYYSFIFNYASCVSNSVHNGINVQDSFLGRNTTQRNISHRNLFVMIILMDVRGNCLTRQEQWDIILERSVININGSHKTFSDDRLLLKKEFEVSNYMTASLNWSR